MLRSRLADANSPRAQDKWKKDSPADSVGRGKVEIGETALLLLNRKGGKREKHHAPYSEDWKYGIRRTSPVY